MTITDTVTRGPGQEGSSRLPSPGPSPVATWPGDDLGSVDLEPSIFGIEPNLAVLHQVVTAQLAAIRSGTQSTKTRSEVRGGGAKPFAQKGTGRARQGSSRSPSMSGGGIALGPEAAQLPAAHAQEDGAPGPSLRPERPGGQQPGGPGRRVGLGEARRPRTPLPP